MVREDVTHLSRCLCELRESAVQTQTKIWFWKELVCCVCVSWSATQTSPNRQKESNSPHFTFCKLPLSENAKSVSVQSF